tara:strand:+ start:332 stop:523 length:192 start_codon:yes stop_codon:yes gene_type:complete
MNLLNEKQVAEQYNIPAGTLRRHRSVGIGFPHMVIGRPDHTKRGGIIRYDVAAITKYLEDQKK